VDLSDDDLRQLDEVSRPTLNFPHDFLDAVAVAIQNGTTVNGVASEPWGGGPHTDDERW
jgi:hypothetical protein